METIAEGGHQAEEGGAGITAPWGTRTAAAWLLGWPVGIAPEDRDAVDQVAAELVREAAARVRR